MQVFYSGMVFLLLSGWLVSTEHSDLPKEGFANEKRSEASLSVAEKPFWASSLPTFFSAEDWSCQDTLIVNLDDQCQKKIFPDDLLEGDLSSWSPEDFVIEVLDEKPDNLNTVDGVGIHRFRIYLKDGSSSDWEGCSGFIKAEDKKAPLLECMETVSLGRFTKKIQRIERNISSDASLFELTVSCKDWPSAMEQGGHYYDAFPVRVSQTGWYAFELEAAWGVGFGALYHHRFDPENICDRLVACSDYPDDGSGFFKTPATARIFAYLHPDQTYILMTTAIEKEQTGAFQWVSYADGEAFIQGVTREEASVYYPLLCGDLERVIDKKESLDWLQTVTKAEDCSLLKTRFADEVIETASCGDVRVRRSVEVKDEWGNAANCTQDITFSRIKPKDILPPLKKVYLSCDSFYVKDDNGHPHPSMTGYPGILSPFGIRSLRLQECNWAVSYFDRSLSGACASSTIILRTWEILDWCDPGQSFSFEQEIVIGDFEGPVFDISIPERSYIDWGRDTFVVSTGPFDCSTTLPIPAPVNIRDNCSDRANAKAMLTSVAGDTLALQVITGTEIIFEDLMPGEYRLTYIVSDECLNASRKTLVLFVRDLITPVAICNDEVNISIGGDGIGRLTSEDVSEGSWDACTPKPELRVRRWIPANCVEEYQTATGLKVLIDSIRNIYYTPWAGELYFTCCDLQEKVRIELEVRDEAGNVDYCWQEVLIEDKIPPVCIAPPSDTLDCTDYFVTDVTDSLELQQLFGVPQIKNEHCPAYWIELPAIWQDRECNEGRLTRRFIAIDVSGNRSDTCFQYIDVRKLHNYEIKFPKDVHNYGCIEAIEDTLEWRELGCDLLAISKDTMIFAPDGDHCAEWRIRHRIINWCEVEGNPIPVGISRNEDKDDMIGEDDVYVIVRPDGRAYVDDNNDETDGFLREVVSTGYWEYTQIIEITDTLVPTVFPDPHEPFCSFSDDCTGRVDFFFTLFDFCGQNNLDIRVYYDENDDGINDDTLSDDQIRGRVPKFRLRGDYPLGDHSFRIEVTDGCGNTVRERFYFSVVDCKAPAPVCVEQLAVELSPVYPPRDVDGDGDDDSGMNVVWVSDFRPVSRFEDCTAIRYSIHRLGEVAHPDSNHLIVTCDDPDPLPVRIYAWDSSFNPERIQPDNTVGGPNYDYCTVFIDLQDNLYNLCNGGITTNVISGRINTQDGAPLENAAVHLSGGAERMVQTNHEGVYAFTQVLTGYDYTLSSEYPDNPLDGVSTFDLVLISKFILGIQDFSSPYQLIAADVNRSGSVSSLDLIQLRKMILNIDKEFSNNRGWRFIDAGFTFDMATTDWLSDLPEWININNFDPFSEDAHNFVAVKVGDVNNSNSFARKGFHNEVRLASDPVVFNYYARQAAGEEIQIDLFAETLTELEGFQFTLAFDPELYSFAGTELRDAVLEKENIGLQFIQEGLITVSWNAPDFTTANKVKKLMRFSLAPLYNQQEHGVRIALNSRLIQAEAYDKKERIHPLQLLRSSPEEHSFTVYGASPNPFQEQTNLTFFLPQAGEVTLEIVDLSGRLLFSRTQQMGKGLQQFFIKDHELGGSGLFFYSLKNGSSIHSGKLMVID